MRDQYFRSPVSDPCKQTMPPDKQTNGTSAKPFTPSISNAFRSGKNPLTPKLAGYSSSNTPRRPVNPPVATADGSTRPDISTTTSPLSSNITPRSAPRSFRKDGLSSPNGTPSGGAQGPRGDSRLGSTLNTENKTGAQTRGVRAKSVANGESSESPSSQTNTGQGKYLGASTFFHASEAKPMIPSSDQDKERTSSSLKYDPNTTFLYADGRTEESSQRNEPRATFPSSRKQSTGNRASIKPPEILLSPRIRQPQPSSYLSRESTGSSSDHWGHSPQPMLDAGISGHQEVQYSKPRDRVSSSGSSKRPSHTKSSSMDSSHYATQPKPTLLASPISSPSFTPHEHQTISPSPDLSPRIASPRTSGSGDMPLPTLGAHSPVREGGQNNAHLQNMNELAANARRERKVLDLEISNSSLLAINRTLEREMRKQNAELRRFRRLSRSGRISLNGSYRSVSGGRLSVVSETDDAHSDHPVDSDEPLSESSDDDSLLSDGDTPSPNAVAEHDAKHRTRDERRFLQDLSKHQQLLVDSQKMNQSIKRCLGRTETMISEAKKALEYHVRVSDVDIGGRVLSPDEIDDGDEKSTGQGLLSPTEELNELLNLPGELESFGFPGLTTHD